MKNENVAKCGLKTCFDCLHCKVSANSTEKNRLCFCDETEKKVRHKDLYWLNKKVCKKFEDMSDPEKRRPLLKRRA
jgi:hypothetical protein